MIVFWYKLSNNYRQMANIVTWTKLKF
jgi:hypothetical protein